jgi:hypothetical protein
MPGRLAVEELGSEVQNFGLMVCLGDFVDVDVDGIAFPPSK